MDTFNEFTLEIAQDLLESSESFPIDFEDAWRWLEYSTKGNAKRFFEKCNFTEGLDFVSFIRNDKREIGATQVHIIKLSIECFKFWAMMSKTETGKVVRKYFLECEKIAKEKQTKPLSVSESLLLSVQQLVEVERRQAKLELEQQKQSEALIQQAVQIEVARVLAEQNQATIAIQQQKIDSLEASLDALRAVINQPLPTCQQTKRQRIVETMQLIGRVIFERKLKPSIHEAMREAWVQLTSKIKHSSARKDLPLQKANMERAFEKAMENWKINGGVKPRKKDYFLTYGELIERNKIEDEALSCANTLALQLL